MSRVICWQLQHGFHNGQKFYLVYGEAQGRATSTRWVLDYAIVIVHKEIQDALDGANLVICLAIKR